MKLTSVVGLIVLLLSSCSTSSEKKEEKCHCTEGTTVNANDYACIDNKRYKCMLDDDTKKYKLKETTETCDEEDPTCEKE